MTRFNRIRSSFAVYYGTVSETWKVYKRDLRQGTWLALLTSFVNLQPLQGIQQDIQSVNYMTAWPRMHG
jgi:hypothetical protein